MTRIQFIGATLETLRALGANIPDDPTMDDLLLALRAAQFGDVELAIVATVPDVEPAEPAEIDDEPADGIYEIDEPTIGDVVKIPSRKKK